MIWESIALLFIGAFILLAGVMVGGWLVFKSKAQPGEGLFHVPKGEMFSIPDPNNPEFPEEPPPENHLKRVDAFMDKFLGSSQPVPRNERMAD